MVDSVLSEGSYEGTCETSLAAFIQPGYTGNASLPVAQTVTSGDC